MERKKFMKLSQVKKEWEKYIVLKDEYAIDMIFATLVGNAVVQRDPVWTMMIAPSSGGKSTLIAPCCATPNVHFLDDLTEKTFLSGYKAKGKEVSLLKIIGSGVMAFSDFTTILGKNQVSRHEILGQLRVIYDGTFSKRTGVGEIKWQGKMGFIGACTPDIYFLMEGARSMGERFIYYWMDQPTDDEIVKKQEEVQMSSREISEAMQPLYSAYIDGIRNYTGSKGTPNLKMSVEHMKEVNSAAIFCAMAKATVHTDFKSGKPDALVNKPGVGRDRKMMNTILHALQVMDAYELDNFEAPVTDRMVSIVKKVAWSSVGRERRKILEILTSYDAPMTASEIGATDNFGLQKESVEKYLWSLHAVGLINKNTRGQGFTWSIEDTGTKDFVRQLSGVSNRELIRSEAEELFEGYESEEVI